MFLPSTEAHAQAALFRLGLTERGAHGRSGDRLGKGTGSSLEFQERRAYVAGDDVRHLDWNAYARTDQLMVRLYREEILPRIDLLIDDSRSMATDPRKAQLTIDTALMMAEVARRSGFEVTPVLLGDRPEPSQLERLEREGMAFAGRRSVPELLFEAAPMLRSGSLRIVISDFLFPADPASLARSLSLRAGGLCMLQILSAADVDPEPGEALRLTDAENGEVLDLVLDEHSVQNYRDRLGRLSEGLSTECRRASGHFQRIGSTLSLAEHCRGPLCRGGVLLPA